MDLGNNGNFGYHEGVNFAGHFGKRIGLGALGIGYQDVVTVLEDEGVAKFAASWKEMLETISTQLAAAGRA